MPHLSAHGRGDMYVNLRVEIPTKLSHEQKDLVEQLDKTMPERSPGPSSRPRVTRDGRSSTASGISLG